MTESKHKYCKPSKADQLDSVGMFLTGLEAVRDDDCDKLELLADTATPLDYFEAIYQAAMMLNIFANFGIDPYTAVGTMRESWNAQAQSA